MTRDEAEELAPGTRVQLRGTPHAGEVRSVDMVGAAGFVVTRWDDGVTTHIHLDDCADLRRTVVPGATPAINGEATP